MAWNEPGGGKEKDPWGREQGPPDLDEAFRKFKKKFMGNGGSGSKSGSGDNFPELSLNLMGIIFAIILLLWALLGIYQVDQQEKGVVLTFGKYSGFSSINTNSFVFLDFFT